MKFVRFLLFCFLAVCLLCFTAILLLPRINDKNIIRLPSKTISRYAEFFAAKFSQAYGYDQANVNRVVSSTKRSVHTALRTPRNGEVNLRNVTDVDSEFRELLKEANHQNEEKTEESLEDKYQEASTETGLLKYDELSCKPHNHIAFLKTHKTGSSTLTNILNRYADLRELIIALPMRNLYRFGWPNYFHWRSVDLWRLNGKPASVLCNHARYRRPLMDVVLHSDTKFITILRDPVYQFESTFNYMELYRFFRLSNYSNPMEVFLRNPHGYLRNLTRYVRSFPESMYLVRNGMFFDLGLHPLAQDNDKEILNAIKKIENEFTLVLMMEYFDESLVLLKREFCWDLDDVIYIKQNERKAGTVNPKKVLSPQLKDKIRAWNRADVLLYNHFNKTFWEKIKQHGRGFYKDLDDLRRKNREMYDDCVSPEEVTETAFRLTGKIRGFKLNEGVSRFNKYLCQKLLRNEIDYINYFRQKLHPYSEYQKQLRAAGRVPPLVRAADNVIAQRIKAMQSSNRLLNSTGNRGVQPQLFPQRLQDVPQRVQGGAQNVRFVPQRAQVAAQNVRVVPQRVQVGAQNVRVVP